MSKLAHSHQPTMDEIDRKRATEDGNEDLIGHTPGPWATGGYYITGNNGKTWVATVKRGDAPDPVGDANARLLAAAPQMLDAIRKHERVLSLRTTYGPQAKPTVAELNAMLDDFRAAIAAAEGRS